MTHDVNARLEDEEFVEVDAPVRVESSVVRRPASAYSILLVCTCFAIPGAGFAAVVTSGAPNGWNVMIPIAAALGAAATALLFWLVLGRLVENIVVSAVLGVAVGVFAHPVTAVLSLVVAFFGALLGFLPDPPGNAAAQVNTVFGVLQVMAVVAFFWCLLSLTGPLYVTAAIGLVTGLIVGGVYSVVGSSDESPWSSAHAGLVAVFIVSVLTSVGVWAGMQL